MPDANNEPILPRISASKTEAEDSTHAILTREVTAPRGQTLFPGTLARVVDVAVADPLPVHETHWEGGSELVAEWRSRSFRALEQVTPALISLVSRLAAADESCLTSQTVISTDGATASLRLSILADAQLRFPEGMGKAIAAFASRICSLYPLRHDALAEHEACVSENVREFLLVHGGGQISVPLCVTCGCENTQIAGRFSGRPQMEFPTSESSLTGIVEGVMPSRREVSVKQPNGNLIYLGFDEERFGVEVHSLFCSGAVRNFLLELRPDGKGKLIKTLKRIDVPPPDLLGEA